MRWKGEFRRVWEGASRRGRVLRCAVAIRHGRTGQDFTPAAHLTAGQTLFRRKT
jgi:hypothetical protein